MNERATFRYTIGAVAIIGGLFGFFGLYFVEVPEGNREPLLLALGLVMGWGSTVIGYEFGSSPAGRKAADAGLRNPSSDDPQPVTVTNDPANPVPVKEKP